MPIVRLDRLEVIRKRQPSVLPVPAGACYKLAALKIDDHIDYLAFRVDPEHVLPAGYTHSVLKK